MTVNIKKQLCLGAHVVHINMQTLDSHKKRTMHLKNAPGYGACSPMVECLSTVHKNPDLITLTLRSLLTILTKSLHRPPLACALLMHAYSAVCVAYVFKESYECGPIQSYKFNQHYEEYFCVWFFFSLIRLCFYSVSFVNRIMLQWQKAGYTWTCSMPLYLWGMIKGKC